MKQRLKSFANALIGLAFLLLFMAASGVYLGVVIGVAKSVMSLF